MAKGLTKQMWQRTLIVCIAIVAVLGLVDVGRLFYLQVIAGEKYQIKAQQQQLSDTTVTAQRGTIYDSNMNIIAQSATVWNLYLNPKKINDDNRDLIVNGISEALGLEEEDRTKLLENTKKETTYVEVAKKIENPQKVAVSDFLSSEEGKKAGLAAIIGMTQTTKRYYPANNFASTVIGFTGTDDQGLAGIEAYYDDVLTGTPGRIITAKDAVSNAMPNEFESRIDAQDGNSLVLTIDQNIQHYLDKGIEDVVNEYNAKGGYGIAMNPKTGEIYAITNKPDFNLNSPWIIDYESNRNKVEAITDEAERTKAQSNAVQAQWRNRVVSDIYVPGSVFKCFVASAALEEKVVSLDYTYTCHGSIDVGAPKPIKCHKHEGHGTQTFVQGLANSCNPFFITVGQKLGAANFYKYYTGFGFTEKTGIDLPGEASPYFKKEEELKNQVTLASASFGQTNSITPIQMCTAIGAIANDGKLMQPYLVKEVLDANGNTVSKTEPTVKRQVISEETAEKVRGMMENVVANGTGKNAYVAGYHVGGKTGTSEKLGEYVEGVDRKKYLVSFAAMAPADDPEIVLLIIIDEPDQDLGGGVLCAPIAASVIEQAMKSLNVEPKYTEEEQAKVDLKMPNLVNSSVSGAKATLTDGGFKYKIVGDGDTVVKQSPTQGVSVPSGATVVLYTESDAEKQTVTVPDFTGCSVSEANARAAEAGVNIKLTGNNLSTGIVVAYKQSEEAGATVDSGTIITVYFKHEDNVNDFGVG